MYTFYYAGRSLAQKRKLNITRVIQNLLLVFVIGVLSVSGQQIGDHGISECTFGEASAVSVDGEGNIVAIDVSTMSIFRIHSDEKIDTLHFGKGWGEREFSQPTDIDASVPLRIYIADPGNRRIHIVDRDGNFIGFLSADQFDNPSERFSAPRSVAVSRQSDIFILDEFDSYIRKYSSLGELLVRFGGFDAGLGRLYHPTRIRFLTSEILCVIDDKRLVLFDTYGNYLDNFDCTSTIRACIRIPRSSSCLIIADSVSLVLDIGNRRFQTSKSNLTKLFDDKQIQNHVVVDGVINREDLFILSQNELRKYQFEEK